MTTASARRRFGAAWAVGGFLGIAVFTWLLAGGHATLLRWQFLSDFYDAQAHAFRHGRLDIDPHVLGIEAFFAKGNAYMYQGPVPALLRLPAVLLFGDRWDGRLTQPSLLAAIVVLVAAAGHLHWRVRAHLRPEAPVTRPELVITASLAFAVGGGGMLLFLASKAWVYHEATLWGAAFTVAAIDQLVAYLLAPRWRPVLAASALTVLAILTRASVALGPVLGLALVSLVHLRRRPRHAAALACAAIAPVLLYVAVNQAKFGTSFSPPFDAQRFTQVDPGRRTFLASNDDSYFGLKFVPATVAHYLDPLGVRPTRLFPFVDFRNAPGLTAGGVRFDLVDRTGGLLAPALVPVTLTIAAAVAVARDRRVRVLAIAVLAAAGSAVGILPFGYIAHRYTGDFAPLLVLGSAIGAPLLLSRPRARPVVVAVVVATGVLLSGWVDTALGLRYQRAWGTVVEPGLIAGFLGVQADTGSVRARQVDALPVDGPAGALVALGDCAGLYHADGMPVNAVDPSPWNSVEGTAEVGWFDLRMTLPDRPRGTRVPLVASNDPAHPTIVFAEYVDASHIRVRHRTTDGLDDDGRPVRVRRGVPVRVRVIADWRVNRLMVRIGDVDALEAYFGYRGPLVVGRNVVRADVASRFPGPLIARTVEAPLCRRLTAGS